MSRPLRSDSDFRYRHRPRSRIRSSSRPVPALRIRCNQEKGPTRKPCRLDTYSKGMRQKILIAAALLHDPDLILLDEPLSGLDVNASIMIKDLIAALASAGKTILYSSHVLDVVEKVCNRVLIIHKGNLIADSTPENLKASTRQSTLEEVFRKLTHAESVNAGISRIVEALRS